MGFRKRCFFVLLLAASAARAADHRVVPTTYYNTFSRAHPILARIAPGDRVITRTLDSAGYDEKGVQRFTASGNPLIGPFYVEGAQPGDALRVRLEKLHLNRNYGYTSYRLELVALMPEYIEHIFPAEYKVDVIVPGRSKSVPWDIDLEHNRVPAPRAEKPRAAV